MGCHCPAISHSSSPAMGMHIHGGEDLLIIQSPLLVGHLAASLGLLLLLPQPDALLLISLYPYQLPMLSSPIQPTTATSTTSPQTFRSEYQLHNQTSPRIPNDVRLPPPQLLFLKGATPPLPMEAKLMSARSHRISSTPSPPLLFPCIRATYPPQLQLFCIILRPIGVVRGIRLRIIPIRDPARTTTRPMSKGGSGMEERKTPIALAKGVGEGEVP